MTHNRRRRQVHSGENSVGNVVEYQTAFWKSIWYKKQIDVSGTQEAGLHCSSKPLSKTPATNGQQERTDQYRPPPGANNLPSLPLLSDTNRPDRWQHGYDGESTQQNIKHPWLIGIKLDVTQSTQSWLLSNDLVSSFSESPPFYTSPLCLIVEWL